MWNIQVEIYHAQHLTQVFGSEQETHYWASERANMHALGQIVSWWLLLWSHVVLHCFCRLLFANCAVLEPFIHLAVILQQLVGVSVHMPLCDWSWPFGFGVVLFIDTYLNILSPFFRIITKLWDWQFQRVNNGVYCCKIIMKSCSINLQKTVIQKVAVCCTI